MSLFSPEAVFGALARMCGLAPEQLNAIVTGLGARLAGWDAEISAFKQASGRMVAHYDARLAAIEASQARLERKLDAIVESLGLDLREPINGKAIEHVGK